MFIYVYKQPYIHTYFSVVNLKKKCFEIIDENMQIIVQRKIPSQQTMVK